MCISCLVEDIRKCESCLFSVCKQVLKWYMNDVIHNAWDNFLIINFIHINLCYFFHNIFRVDGFHHVWYQPAWVSSHFLSISIDNHPNTLQYPAFQELPNVLFLFQNNIPNQLVNWRNQSQIILIFDHKQANQIFNHIIVLIEVKIEANKLKNF